MHRLLGSRAWTGSLRALAVATAASTTYALSQRRQDARLAFTAAEEPVKWARLPSPADKTVEKVTGAQFVNAVVREEGGEKLMRLCATSVRCMMGLCWLNRARAYAFGIYLGSTAVEDLVVGGNGELQSINKVPESRNRGGDAPFYPSNRFTGSKDGYIFQNGISGLGYYRDDKSPKWATSRLASPVLIRLVMQHDVDGEHLAHGFEKTFKTRITPELDPAKQALGQITQFTTILRRLEKLPKGAQIDLVRSESGVLTLSVENQVFGHFDDLLMGWAVVDAFIGPKGHLGAEGKKELVENARKIHAVRPLAEFM